MRIVVRPLTQSDVMLITHLRQVHNLTEDAQRQTGEEAAERIEYLNELSSRFGREDLCHELRELRDRLEAWKGDRHMIEAAMEILTRTHEPPFITTNERNDIDQKVYDLKKRIDEILPSLACVGGYSMRISMRGVPQG